MNTPAQTKNGMASREEDSVPTTARDGRRFIKSAELSEAFSQTEAYSNLYMELITNADAAAAFINGIVPEDVAQAAAVARKEREESEVTDEAEKPVEKVEDNADAPVRLLNN